MLVRMAEKVDLMFHMLVMLLVISLIHLGISIWTAYILWQIKVELRESIQDLTLAINALPDVSNCDNHCFQRLLQSN